VGRIDMGYPRWKVGVEYDGPQHWTDPAVRDRDLERRARLAALGWRIVHVNAEMLRYRPAVIVGRTESALADARRT
jgi:very-short-patch-repair endonuclease